MALPLTLGFSTIGCPEASAAEVGALACSYGLQFVELRALGGKLDLSRYFEERVDAATELRVPVRVFDTSLSLLQATAEDLEAFYRLAALAHRMEVRHLRVFGDGGASFGPALSREQLERAAATVLTAQERLRREGWMCELLLETHDVFSSSDRCLALNARLEQPLPFLWDSGHTWEKGGETLAETWRQLGPRVVHVHYKDFYRPAASGGKECLRLPGEGEFPAAELRDLLLRENFTGGLSLEWEKLWHPELPDLKEALPGFVRLFRSE